MDEILDLAQQNQLDIGEGQRTITLSEGSYNLIASLLSLADSQDRWGNDGLDLADADWPEACQLVATALWEVS
jgi:hypothetical protein